jgi:hypothetical protein
MIKAQTVILFLFITIISCKPSGEVSTTNESATQETQTTFGEAFKVENVISYDSLLVRLASEETVDKVVVEGKVDAVCQTKGCWMNIVSETDPDAEKLFVKFHDYGFFMPFDLAGSKVVMKGKAYKEITSVEELQHYAEDEGKSVEEIAQITEPVTEIKFMATGVEIVE